MLEVQKSGRRLLFRLICVYGVQSLGMLVPMFKDEMAMLAESVSGGGLHGEWVGETGEGTKPRCSWPFAVKIIPFLTDFPLWCRFIFQIVALLQ